MLRFEQIKDGNGWQDYESAVYKYFPCQKCKKQWAVCGSRKASLISYSNIAFSFVAYIKKQTFSKMKNIITPFLSHRATLRQSIEL